jgi:hypothetical protein
MFSRLPPMVSDIFRDDRQSVDRLDDRLRSRSGARFLRKTDGFNPDSNFTKQATENQKLEILGEALRPSTKIRLFKSNPGSFDTLSDELNKKINRIETSVENLRYFAVALGIKIIENSSTKQAPEKITIDDFKQLHRLISNKTKSSDEVKSKIQVLFERILNNALKVKSIDLSDKNHRELIKKIIDCFNEEQSLYLREWFDSLQSNITRRSSSGFSNASTV